jgi:hypothetical protein
VENWRVAKEQADLLVRLEQDVLDRTVPLADVLRSCLILAGQTRAAQVRDWATAELKGYRISAVPDYRKVAAPILWAFDLPYRGLVTHVVNVHSWPERLREHLSELVPLNQPVDELEALASRCEAQNKQLELGVFGGDQLTAMWNQNHPYEPSAVANASPTSMNK